ncbi:hypothetical protein L486_03256 [Kwoniella mangroviensis CBS 10435]|uniref:Uncharacterized protein n=1 Tax=Kwoniella mangroviensis CBS 10435 TaxID=1331196 RepID=A0A1B9ITB1_9TREE|nr:hypothetical protein L486_03256 [Kwoniella mangroviensis CBS 10435]
MVHNIDPNPIRLYVPEELLRADVPASRMDWADLINRQDYVDIPIAQDQIDMAILHSPAYTVDFPVDMVHIKEEVEDSNIPSMSQINKQLRALTDRMNKSQAALEASIMAKVNAHLNTLTDRVDKLESSLDDITNHVKQFDERFSHLEARIDDITTERRINSINLFHPSLAPISGEANHQAQEDLTIRLDRLSDKLVLTTSQIDRLDNKVDRLDGKVGRYDIKVDKLEIKIDKHQDVINIHDEKLQGSSEPIGVMDDTISQLGDKLEEHAVRTDEMDHQLKRLEGQMNDRIKEEEKMEVTKRSIKTDHDGLRKEFNNFVEQVNVREMNRVLLEIPRRAHPVSNLRGDSNPSKTSNNGLFLPCAIKEMKMDDLDKWVTFYGIGKDCKDFGFLEDVNKQGKQALLYNFIGGSNKPSYFKG